MFRLMVKDFRKRLNIFIIASSVSIITLGYLGSAYGLSKCPSNIGYMWFPVLIPLIYGIFGLINEYIIDTMGINYSFVVGATFGLLLSLVGRFILNLPVLLFNFTKSTEYKVHIYAMIMYAAIFQFIITPLTQYIV